MADSLAAGRANSREGSRGLSPGITVIIGSTRELRPWFARRSDQSAHFTLLPTDWRRMSQAEPTQPDGRIQILAVILLAAVVRAMVMIVGSGQFDDPDNYLPLARSLAAGEGLSLGGRLTAYRPPLYPILLAPLVLLPGGLSIRGIALLHIALGAATVGLTVVTARRCGLCRRRSLA